MMSNTIGVHLGKGNQTLYNLVQQLAVRCNCTARRLHRAFQRRPRDVFSARLLLSDYFPKAALAFHPSQMQLHLFFRRNHLKSSHALRKRSTLISWNATRSSGF